MVEGKTESLDAIGWGHLSNLMAHLSNINRAKGGAITRPEDINPYVDHSPDLVIKVPITILRDLFVPQGDNP